jgi:Uncharacterized protein conserved in bacteria (DUF2064)
MTVLREDELESEFEQELEWEGEEFLGTIGNLRARPPWRLGRVRRRVRRRGVLPPQRRQGEAARIAAAFDGAFARSAQPALLIGMDTLQITLAWIDRCTVDLGRPGVDAVLGLAGDGSWRALGLRHPDAGRSTGSR